MRKLPKCALVTAIGSFSAKAAIDTLHAQGIRVVGCDIYPAEWVANSSDVDAFYNVPYATDTDSFLAAIQRIVEAESVEMILPSTDYEVDAFSGRRSEISAVVCMSSDRALKYCRDKLSCYKALTGHVDECHRIPTSLLSEIELDRFSYPAVCKPLHGRSSSGLFTAQNAQELAAKRSEVDADAYCIQPKVAGTIVTVDVLCHEGTVIAIPRRELLRTLNGAGTSVEVFVDVELTRLCKEIADVLGVEGCVNFEFIEQDNGRYRFLECNPRFSGGIAFSQMSGYDFVLNHIRHFAGLPIDALEHVTRQFIARRYVEYSMRIEEVSS